MSPYSREEILHAVIDALKQTLQNSPRNIALPEALREDTTFQSIHGLDSLDSVELVARLEERYQIWMKSNEWTDMKTLGDLCDYIEKGLRE